MPRKQISDAAAVAAVIKLLDDARTAGVPSIRASTLETALGLTPKPSKGEPHELVFANRRQWRIEHPPTCQHPDDRCPAVRAAHRTLTEATLRPGRYKAWIGESGFLCVKPTPVVRAA